MAAHACGKKAKAASSLPAAPLEVLCRDVEDPVLPALPRGTRAEAGPASCSGRDGVQAGKVRGDPVQGVQTLAEGQACHPQAVASLQVWGHRWECVGS